MIKTILLADDSLTMQKVIRLTFASGGYELSCADNGDEALKKARDLRPNIVLVDAALPGKNGYEVCEAIKNDAELRDTPVIILAGTFNPLDDQKAQDARCDDSIVKPFESRQLTDKVKSLLLKYPPAEKGPTNEPLSGDEPNWADDDIISAPEPASAADEPLSPLAEKMEEDSEDRTVQAPDLDRLEGQGIIIEEGPAAHGEELSSGEEADTEEEAAIPTMETAEGESEGEGGFDIEGFEINPFKSEPLREKSPLVTEDAVISGWNVDEDDVIGFNDLETEDEIETGETPHGTDAGHETIEMPAADSNKADEELLIDDDAITDVIEAEEELPEPEGSLEAEETLAQEEQVPAIIEDTPEGAEPLVPDENEGEAATESVGQPSEQWIRELVSKIVTEAIEEAMRDIAPELIKNAIEEVVRDVAPELTREAVRDEMERIKEAIRGL